VNCIAPGLIRTDSRARWLKIRRLSRPRSTTPLKRVGEADDIAGAALFLAPPQDDSYRQTIW